MHDRSRMDQFLKQYGDFERWAQEPSEPRRRKRAATNPHARRPGRGQTTSYGANKVATESLVIKTDAHEEVAEHVERLNESDPYTSSEYWADSFQLYRASR